MPLNAVDFVPKGPVKSADINQFFNLFTGVMVDQPVTFSNALNVGGNQGTSTVPLKLYGSVGQTGHLIDLYTDRTQAQPGFGFSALGTFGWGPGGNAPIDTAMARTVPGPGLTISPNLSVSGIIYPQGPIIWPSGASINDAGGSVTAIGVHLEVQGNIYVGLDRAQFLNEIRPGEIGLTSRLLVNGADAEGSGLTYAVGYVQTRGADMTDVAGAYSFPFSAMTFASNWVQFNPTFFKVTAGVGWPGIALLLDYDVDAASPGIGGRISMMNGKVGIGPNVVAAAGTVLQIFGDASATGGIVAAGQLTGGTGQINGNLNVHTITIDSASDRAGAPLAFPQVVGPKVNLYDSSPTQFFGLGINGSEMYAAVPSSAVFNIRVDGGAGAVIASTSATSGQLAIQAPAAPLSQIILNPTGSQPIITFVTPTDPQGGGQVYRNIKPSNRPASSVGGGEVQIDLRLYVDGDITAGTYMHAAGFLTTPSYPEAKSNAIVMADTTCMARVRGNVPVYQYTLPPPSNPGYPQPNTPTIGFMAPDMQANSPEFVGLDASGAPVSVIYGQIVALLWGALRALDTRCQAAGI